jgi:hypothetical protein
MRTYMIEGETNSPNVFIDELRQLVEISGNSTLKDANWFYSNVLRWILAFNSGNLKTKTFNIKLQRINESSYLWLEIIIKKMFRSLPSSDFEINWYICKENRKIQEKIIDLQNQSGIRMNLV